MTRILAILSAVLFLYGTVCFAAGGSAIPVDQIDNKSAWSPPKTLQTSQGLIEGVIAVKGAAEYFFATSIVIESSPVYEYDSLGRVIKTTFSGGDYIITSYWGATTTKYVDGYYQADGTWEKTYQYGSDGILQYEWVADAHPGTAGDEIAYAFDSSGRIIYKRIDDGSSVSTQYWNTTDPQKKIDEFSDPAGTWQKSIEYYPDGITIHFQWMADAHPGTAGDDVTYEFDLKGRLIYKHMDDGSSVSTQYWNAIKSWKKTEEFSDSTGTWQKSIEYNYYPNNTIIHYKWIADVHPGVAGDAVIYAYDTMGRLIYEKLDNDSSVSTQYWNATDPQKKIDEFTDPAGNWQKSIEYYPDGTTMHYQWVIDPSIVHKGDIVIYGYDTRGRITYRKTDTGYIITTDYVGDSNTAYRDSVIDSIGQWLKTTEYYEDGITAHYRWFADLDPALSGDILFEEYSSSGETFFRLYDDGTTWPAL